MTGPYSVDQKRIEAIRAQIEADPEAYLNQTAPPTEGDFAFMGRVIQSYCFADLNARRIIDHIHYVAFGRDKQNAGMLQDTQVFPKLREAAGVLPGGNIREGLVKAANTIEMHLVHRHQFAHWATRRIVDHDVLVMFTMNARQVEKRLGSKPSPDVMTFALVPLGPEREQLTVLEGHGRYLAEVAADIASKLPAFKMLFDEERAAAQAIKYEAGKYKKGAMGPPEG